MIQIPEKTHAALMLIVEEARKLQPNTKSNVWKVISALDRYDLQAARDIKEATIEKERNP